ncbi:MAG: LacI family DNA-binding transcriptional regulator [Candidatus Limivicinus sp.]|nr:LacI family DNA-binding transcriptional regulator [Candidatus Limivicinus sp.]
MKKVTMTMIAEACNTSIGTVDRAINNRAEINPETKNYILETARKMGYKLPSAKKEKNKLCLAFISPSKPEGFYSCIDMGMEKAKGELADSGITIERLNFDAQNPASQLDLLAGLDIKKYDGVALNPLSVACTEYIDRFSAAGVPVVTFNNDLPNSTRLFYVGINSMQSARMAADVMATLLGGKGGVAVLGNFGQTMPFFERFGGFCQVLQQDYPEINIYSTADCRLDPEVTEKNIYNLMEKTPDIRGIFCTGYSSTIDTIRAMKKFGRKDMVVVGYDVGDETVDAIRNGWCKALLYQDPFQQGYQSVHLLARHLTEGWMPSHSLLIIEPRLVFRQNIDNYVGGVMQWDLRT